MNNVYVENSIKISCALDSPSLIDMPASNIFKPISVKQNRFIDVEGVCIANNIA